jgi:hypothetical protein
MALLELECLDWRSNLKKAVLLKNKNWISFSCRIPILFKFVFGFASAQSKAILNVDYEFLHYSVNLDFYRLFSFIYCCVTVGYRYSTWSKISRRKNKEGIWNSPRID